MRSFRDEEVNSTLRAMIKDEGFLYILRKIFTEERIQHLSTELNEVNSVYDFQSKYISFYVNVLIGLSISEFSYDGLDKLDHNRSYLFISNHRDIVLDSALINEILFRNKFTTTEIAIGNNLLIYKWIEDLVRLNKSFIVRRDLTGKEMLQETVKMSTYLRDTIVNRNNSVWIAQKEGRSKDGNDYTDATLLKMLSLGGSNKFVKDFSELRIVPVSISYEIEPSIESKVAATYCKLRGLKYKKTWEDDLKDMGRGLYNMKGKVHISFGKVIHEELGVIDAIENKNEKYEKLAEIIDEQIHKNFRLTKSNYMAFDILNNSVKCLKENKYLKEEETKFKVTCKKAINNLEGDYEVLQKIYYGIYANPLINKISIP
jgi:1-acyl-sn-glycerol-3-phosphate acyltransferase